MPRRSRRLWVSFNSLHSSCLRWLTRKWQLIVKGVRLHHRPHQSRRKKRNNKSWKPVKLFWKKQYSQENTWRFIQKFFQFEKKFDKCWPPDKRTLFLRFVVASSQVTFLCIEHFARVLDGSTSQVDVHFWIFSEVVVIREHNILKRGLKFICLLGCASVSIKFIWKQFHSIFIASSSKSSIPR